MTWAPEILAYMAGIIDGEGTLSIRKRRNGKKTIYLHPQIQVSNTDKTLIDWIGVQFDGHVGIHRPASYDHNGYKTLHRWTLSSIDEIKELLEAIGPYLIIKKIHSEILLELCTTKSFKKFVKLDSDARELRASLRDKILSLNQRGLKV